MLILFRCDQCSHEEWREADQEPWLCAVCGWMRWSVIATDEPDATDEPGGPSGSGLTLDDAPDSGDESKG